MGALCVNFCNLILDWHQMHPICMIRRFKCHPALQLIGDMLLISEDWSVLTKRVRYKCSIFKSSFLLFVTTSSYLLRPLTIPSVKEAKDESQVIMNTINFLHWDDEDDLFPLKTQKPQEESRIWTTPAPRPPWSGCDVLIWPLLNPTIGLPCHPLGPHTLGIILASLFNTTPHL